MKKAISLLMAIGMFSMSILSIGAYGNITRTAPDVTQRESWLCAPSSVASTLTYINQVYLSSYSPLINTRAYQVTIGYSVGVGNPDTNNPSYGGDDTTMKNYLNSHQTYRPTPYVYTVKPVYAAPSGVTGFLNNIYNSLSNYAPAILHVKCNFATFGYNTTGGHFMVAYAISGASSSPSGTNIIGVVDPNRQLVDPSLSPKTTYTGKQLHDATRENAVWNVIS
ncbi:hypothetical protein FACS1894132_09050 [Clostridia bacterium]|nr:hypothetical protein FACS1894132_09050 [Clostridia bacterium]